MRKLKIFVTDGRVDIQGDGPASSNRPGQVAIGQIGQAGQGLSNQPGPEPSFPQPVLPDGPLLTPRETQVLKFVVEGLTNGEIAAEMQVSVKTVEKHRQAVMNKLRLHETAGLTRYAIGHGITLEPPVHAALLQRMQGHSRRHSPNGSQTKPAKPLTARELEVLKLIADGLGNKQIASELRISIKTVVNHRQELMKRLDLHEVASLTRYAISKGLVALTTSLPMFVAQVQNSELCSNL